MGRARTRGNAGRRSRPETGNAKWIGQGDRATRKQSCNKGKRERARGYPVGGHYLTRLTTWTVRPPRRHPDRPHKLQTFNKPTSEHGPDMDDKYHSPRPSQRNVGAADQAATAAR